MVLPESTLSCLRREVLEGVPGVGCIDGLKVGTFPFRDIFARTDDVHSTSLSSP